MKRNILLASGLIALLLPGISRAQNGSGCSGHFDIVYPSGTSTATATTNNGTGTTNGSYCPPAAGSTQQITVTPTSNSTVLLTRTLADNTVTTYNAGTVIGGTTYTFLFPPASQSATYRLTGTTVGCNNPKALDYSLTLAPTLTLVASQSTVCAGSSTVLTATGSTGTYTLTGFNTPTQTNTTGIFAVSPTVSTTYTVTAPTGTACGTSSQQLTVVVPELTVTPASASIVLGNSVTFAALTNVTGATYSWQNMTTNALLGVVSTPTLVPLTTVVYRVTSTVAGCTLSKDVPVTVRLAPLPVVLSSFEATWAADGPALSWTTASETNNHYFAIERSLDGVAFTAIGRQAGAGTATAAHRYQFADAAGVALGAPMLYYRLRQVDLDGKATYSPVRTVAVPAAAGVFDAVVFPNPWVEVPTVQLVGQGTGALTLTLCDVLGKTLFTQTAAPAGAQQLALSAAAGLPAGVYFLRISQGTARQVVKLTH